MTRSAVAASISDDAIEGAADRSRNLGVMDAFRSRGEQHLGLGCAAETHMLVSAGPNGYDVQVAAVEGSPRSSPRRRSPRLRRRFGPPEKGPRSAPDGSYRAIAWRHSQSLRSRAVLGGMGGLAEFLRRTGDGRGMRHPVRRRREDRRAFDAAVVEATQALIDDKTMIADSDRWFRSERTGPRSKPVAP